MPLIYKSALIKAFYTLFVISHLLYRIRCFLSMK
uniref:Uncharacterized protein n=1 Tax=Podoviridae sp. ctUSJ1 TaxID=2826558 RepID=A0A8S5NFW3_9CAUD|nr:MAG TPA: hypothetical protein [Podoviridae sp. ctUSJ1]